MYEVGICRSNSGVSSEILSVAIFVNNNDMLDLCMNDVGPFFFLDLYLHFTVSLKGFFFFFFKLCFYAYEHIYT